MDRKMMCLEVLHKGFIAMGVVLTSRWSFKNNVFVGPIFMLLFITHANGLMVSPIVCKHCKAVNAIHFKCDSINFKFVNCKTAILCQLNCWNVCYASYFYSTNGYLHIHHTKFFPQTMPSLFPIKIIYSQNILSVIESIWS